MSSQAGGLLDQVLLEDIARHCPQQFLKFHQCMTQETPDPNYCVPQQVNLAKCIKYEVPAFQKVQNECASKLKDYENCLRGSENDTTKCNTELQSLRDCASGTLNK